MLENLANQKIQNQDDKSFKPLTSPLAPKIAKNDIENRDETLPSAEAGMVESSTEPYTELYNENENMQFTTPDEFKTSKNPSASREEVTLGRGISSATKQSTAQAAPISSEVSSNDAKKKI